MNKSNLPLLQLMTASPEIAAPTTADAARGVEASLLAMGDREFADVTAPARCSSTAGGGAAPYGAKWYEYFCPAYGEA
jgi:hypothetical protein